jgi:hypothetical protein
MLIKTISPRTLKRHAKSPIDYLIAAFERRHWLEFGRAIRNGKWWADPDSGECGISPTPLFRGRGGLIMPDGTSLIVPNTISDEGRNYILDAGLRNQTVVTTWYFAPFSDNATPARDWTGDNFADTKATEQTNYTEGTRQAWTPAAASGAIMNTSSNTTLTADTGGATVYGAALLSSSVKGDHSAASKLWGAFNYGSGVVYAATKTIEISYFADLSA